MGKYRKKPVVIDAVQLPTTAGVLSEEIVSFLISADWWYSTDDTNAIVIHTLEGDMIASPGDWIIRGVNGEFYPCKPDIFEQTYEPA